MPCVNDWKDLSGPLSGINFDSVLSSVKGDAFSDVLFTCSSPDKHLCFRSPPHRLSTGCLQAVFFIYSAVLLTHILWINLIAQGLQVGLLNTARVQQGEYEVAAEYELNMRCCDSSHCPHRQLRER